jgi:hypothetical protein
VDSLFAAASGARGSRDSTRPNAGADQGVWLSRSRTSVIGAAWGRARERRRAARLLGGVGPSTEGREAAVPRVGLGVRARPLGGARATEGRRVTTLARRGSVRCGCIMCGLRVARAAREAGVGRFWGRKTEREREPPSGRAAARPLPPDPVGGALAAVFFSFCTVFRAPKTCPAPSLRRLCHDQRSQTR